MHLKDPSAVLTGRLLQTWGDPINDKAAGVGLSLSSRAQKALIFANAISPRILMARFKDLIGRWSIHPNDDQGGTLLRHIMRRQGLCAISTMFQPQKTHTSTTWIKANMKPSQIDHILVGTRCKNWARLCKVRWGASRQRWG